jgi:16S rRNA (uracil1498-N3)-methyltransferase
MPESPLFFSPERLVAGQQSALPEEAARHIAQVLRMRAGDALQLTDGRGWLADCRISEASKKHVQVQCTESKELPVPVPALQLAIAFTKNASRNEWLLEKATELGVRRITPLTTSRSVRERIRYERWTSILTSAMLQSRQCWLPQLDEPTPFEKIFTQLEGMSAFIAHCMEPAEISLENAVPIPPRMPLLQALKKGQNAAIFVGPEGDFTPAELTLATVAGATPVSLGTNRLRTETAALAAITCFYLLNHASAL